MSKASKQRLKEHSLKLLKDNRVAYQSFNDGIHLRISHNGIRCDFWPTTGKFKIEEPYFQWGRGAEELVSILSKTRKKMYASPMTESKKEKLARLMGESYVLAVDCGERECAEWISRIINRYL